MTFEQIDLYFQFATIALAFLAVLCVSAIGVIEMTTDGRRPPRLRNTGKRARHMSKRATYRYH